MGQIIPEGFYSLAEVFNAIGWHIFKDEWSHKEIECFTKTLHPRAQGLLEQVKDFRAYRYSVEEWEEIRNALYKASAPSQESKAIHSEDVVLTIKNILATHMRFKVVIKGLLKALDAGCLKAIIKDTNRGATVSIAAHNWLAKNIEYNLINSTGSYEKNVHYSTVRYKGLLLVEKGELLEFMQTLNSEYKEKAENAPLVQELSSSWPAYTTPEIEAIKNVIIKNKITNENQPTAEQACDLLKAECPKMSKNIATTLATVIRLPEARVGGYHKSDRFKGLKDS